MGDIFKKYTAEILAIIIGIPVGLALVYGDELKKMEAKEMNRKLTSMKFDTVVSYATRPIRPYETNGKEHYFISDKEAEEILYYKDSIAAYTQIGVYKYFTTWEELSKKNLYVIDPTGVDDLLTKAANKEHLAKKFVVIYINTNKATRLKRAKGRSGFNKKVYETRSAAEDLQFKDFETNIKKTYIDKFADKVDVSIYVVSNNGLMGKTLNHVNTILANTYTEDTLYLIVGRTCSGKDTICKEIINEVNRLKEKGDN